MAENLKNSLNLREFFCYGGNFTQPPARKNKVIEKLFYKFRIKSALIMMLKI